MSPYKGIGARYHMPEFTDAPPPQGGIENFNYLHSSLRTTIEHTFGMLKATWKILEHRMPPLKAKDQINVIFASCTLHNMIRLHQKGISISLVDPHVEGTADTTIFDAQRKRAMKHVRDEIADNI